MFAVIKTGGKQYKVQKGDVLQIEKLDLEEGQKATFNQVLLIDDEEKTLIGTPFLKNALVKGEVLENFRDKKIIVFKKKRRKQYRKKIGHRQDLTRIRIEEIVFDLKAAPKKERVKPKEKKAPQRAKLKKEEMPRVIRKERPEKPAKAKAGKKISEVKSAKPVTKPEESKAKVSTKKKVVVKTAPQARKSKKMKEKKDGS